MPRSFHKAVVALVVATAGSGGVARQGALCSNGRSEHAASGDAAQLNATLAVSQLKMASHASLSALPPVAAAANANAFAAPL